MSLVFCAMRSTSSSERRAGGASPQPTAATSGRTRIRRRTDETSSILMEKGKSGLRPGGLLYGRGAGHFKGRCYAGSSMPAFTFVREAPPSLSDQVALFHNLAQYLKSGIPMMAGLAHAQEQCSARMRPVLAGIQHALEVRHL